MKAVHDANLDAKQSFFSQLLALRESSDEEQEIDNARTFLGKRKKLPTTPSVSFMLTTSRIREVIFEKEHWLQRTTSEPAPNDRLIQEIPPVRKGPPSYLSEPMSILSPDASLIRDTSVQSSVQSSHAWRDTISNPTLGADSLVLNYSTGIESMLGKRNHSGSVPPNGKKKLRKRSTVDLVSESEQIFQGKVFYYIPPDDKAQPRRIRINKAIKFGATWTTELTLSTTHIVVDKTLTFKDVMTFLKLETLPSNIIMVSEDYPIDSIESRFLLDPKQKQYTVNGYQEMSKVERAAPPSPTMLEHASEDTAALKQPPSHSKELVDGSEIDDAPARVQISQPKNHDMGPRGERLEAANMHSLQEMTHSTSPILAAKLIPFGDDHEKMVKLARSMEHIPINDEDDDQEDDIPPSRDQSDESGSDVEPRRPSSHSRPKSKWKGSRNLSFNQERFTCMTGGTGITTDSNPNARTIEILQKMADYYVETRDHWRQTAYRKTIGVLRKQNTKISSYDEAIRLPTIGHRLALKIEEIVLTNGLRRLNDAVSDPRFHVLQTFMNIYGVGINQAWNWVQQGHTSLEDLKAHVSLTKNQQLGIEHYDEFLTRISREEVTALGNFVRDAAVSIDPKVEVIIGGSYRRGASSSGDIDFILTKRSTTSSQELLEFLTSLTNHLTKVGFLVAALSTPSLTGSKWHGCCVLPGILKSIWRRIDFLLVPGSELGAALIYFTGDDIFNRSIRLLASKKGWRLNQRGLYKDVLRGPGRVRLNEGSLIEGTDEKKIFAALGVPWRPPEQRICN